MFVTFDQFAFVWQRPAPKNTEPKSNLHVVTEANPEPANDYEVSDIPPGSYNILTYRVAVSSANFTHFRPISEGDDYELTRANDGGTIIHFSPTLIDDLPSIYDDSKGRCDVLSPVKVGVSANFDVVLSAFKLAKQHAKRHDPSTSSFVVFGEGPQKRCINLDEVAYFIERPDHSGALKIFAYFRNGEVTGCTGTLDGLRANRPGWFINPPRLVGGDPKQ